MLLAPQNSYIVVDEPETFLNAAIYNELWDLLIVERSDCQFVFASHNINFILARNNATYVWCKQFIPPSEFHYSLLQRDSKLPISLQIELSGARKPILFCKGEVGSLDYKIYSQLFSERFLVKPVKGHKNVINYTVAYNELSDINSNKAYGIVDYDWMSKERIDALESKNIYVTPFNEIEMLLLCDEVVTSVIGAFNTSEQVELMKTEFYKVFINKCLDRKLKISSIALKKKLDEFVSGHLIQVREPSIEDALTYLSSFSSEFDVESELEKINVIIDNACSELKIEELLKICNLKKEILDGLANLHLDNNYSEKAISRLSLDHTLSQALVKKYFNKLSESV